MQNRRLELALTTCFLVSAISQSAQAGHYDFTILHAPQDGQTQPTAINDKDEVVGLSVPKDGSSIAFTWYRGKYTLIPDAQTLVALNDQGIALGYAPGSDYVVYDTSSGTLTPYTLAGRTDIKYLFVSGSNRDGAISAELVRGREGILSSAVVIHGDKARKIHPFNAAGAINDSGELLVYGNSNGETTSLYKANDVVPVSPPGATSVFGYFLTKDNTVGGTFTDAAGNHGFLFKDAAYTTYDYPGGSDTTVRGVGAEGQVVGSFRDTNNAFRMFVFSAGTYFEVQPADTTDISITGVNALGNVTGYYFDARKYHAFIATCPKSQQPCTR